jgi:hypothetical protein
MRETVIVCGQNVNVCVEKHPKNGWIAVGEFAGNNQISRGPSSAAAIKRWRDTVIRMQREQASR